MKTLGAYLKNLAEKPEEEKYRSINAENPKFKQRIAQLIGGVALLKAVGFEKDDAEGKFVLGADAHAANLDVIKATLAKLEEGYNAYVQAGPGGAGP